MRAANSSPWPGNSYLGALVQLVASDGSYHYKKDNGIEVYGADDVDRTIQMAIALELGRIREALERIARSGDETGLY